MIAMLRPRIFAAVLAGAVAAGALVAPRIVEAIDAVRVPACIFLNATVTPSVTRKSENPVTY